jgi:hypothetical protein
MSKKKKLVDRTQIDPYKAGINRPRIIETYLVDRIPTEPTRSVLRNERENIALRDWDHLNQGMTTNDYEVESGNLIDHSRPKKVILQRNVEAPDYITRARMEKGKPIKKRLWRGSQKWGSFLIRSWRKKDTP